MPDHPAVSAFTGVINRQHGVYGVPAALPTDSLHRTEKGATPLSPDSTRVESKSLERELLQGPILTSHAFSLAIRADAAKEQRFFQKAWGS